MAIKITPVNAQKVWVFSQNGDGTLSPATIGGGGGGTVTNIATTSPITGGPITATGTIGCATCTTNAAALTANALVLGAGGQATSVLGSLGTTSTVLHGNAAGAPTFGAVNLASDVSGQLPISSVGSAGLSGTGPITISAAGAIGCATCNTTAATVTSVSGTANQIGVATGTTTPVISLSSTLVVPGTFTNSTAGAASSSPMLLNGTLFSGGSTTTTFPYFYINQGTAPTTFSANGTLLGLNAPNGFTGNFIDTHNNGGAGLFSVNANGTVTTTNSYVAGATSQYNFNGSTRIINVSDGVMTLSNSAQTAFTRLNLGGTTTSFPALATSSAGLAVQLANASAGTFVTASLFSGSTGTASAIANFALSGGFGTTAAVTSVTGFSNHFRGTITASGTGQGANPTITVTLPTALISAATPCLAHMSGGTGTNSLISQTTLSTTAPVFTFQGTPGAGSTYIVDFICGP